MRIAILSDFHLGFGKGTEREDEAFEQAKQAVELALQENADAILFAGDLFDKDVPSQETWVKAFRLFSLLKKSGGKGARVKKSKKGKDGEFSFTHTPVIAIAGTHEFRSKDFSNALEVLEEAGCLVHLHAAAAELELGGERLAVQGMSGVPEKKAADALKMWNPKPVQGAINVLMLHQSIKEFLPFDDDMVASISLSQLPSGFNLLVDGHLHWRSEENLEKRRFIVPGSTLITQMKRREAGKEKGICVFETREGKVRFIPLPKQRKFFYAELEFREATAGEVENAVGEKMQSLLQGQGNEKPLVKLKLKGTLAKGLKNSDLSLGNLRENFREKAILSMDRLFKEVGFTQRLEQLRAAQQGKKSISKMGFELLEKNLGETDFNNAFDVKRVFDLLAEGETGKVVELLSQADKKD